MLKIFCPLRPVDCSVAFFITQLQLTASVKVITLSNGLKHLIFRLAPEARNGLKIVS